MFLFFIRSSRSRSERDSHRDVVVPPRPTDVVPTVRHGRKLRRLECLQSTRGQSKWYISPPPSFRIFLPTSYKTISCRLFAGWYHLTRRLFRFSSSTWNFGTADFRPFQNKEQWEWHQCHMYVYPPYLHVCFWVIQVKSSRILSSKSSMDSLHFLSLLRSCTGPVQHCH